MDRVQTQRGERAALWAAHLEMRRLVATQHRKHNPEVDMKNCPACEIRDALNEADAALRLAHERIVAAEAVERKAARQ